MKKRNLKWLIIPAILLLMIVFVGVEARADFGNFSGDSDYGGSDYGYDGGDSDSDSFIVYILYLIFSMLPWPLKVILIVVLVVSYITAKAKRNKSGGNNAPQRAGTTPTSDGRGFTTPPVRRMAEYTKLDPSFDQAAFSQKVSNLYVQMQNCWTAKDITPLRPYFTDEQFAQYERQLQESINNNETNHIDRIAVLDVSLLGYYQTGGYDHIVLSLSTRITTYTTKDGSDEVIRGSRTAEKFMVYMWDMARPTGTTTRKDGETVSIACPNCGAPLNINKSAKCPYCDSIVTVDEHDFVIYEIKGIKQETRGK